MSVRSKANRDGEASADPDCDGDELPQGWATVRLPDIAELVMGQSPPSSTYNTEQRGLPFFQGKAEFGELHPTPRKFCDTPGKIAEPNDILMTIRAPVGPTNLCATRSCIGRGLAAIRARGEVPSLYLLYFFRSIEEWLSRQGTGSTFTAINKDDLSAIELPLPPLAEQWRIVKKLELLLGKVSSNQQRLSRVPSLLKRFRQSVLAAACSGKLTADWREENEKDVFEERISTAVASFHRKCWERDQLERMKAKGTRSKNDKWKAAYESPMFEPMDESPELPERWDWIRLGLLGRDPLNTVQTGPFGAQLHNDEFTPKGIPVIAVGNLTGMGFKQEGLYFITPQKAEQLSRYDVQTGDVLFARSGATLGKVCVAPPFVRDWRMTGHILRVRLNTDFILPEIVVFALHGDPSVRYQVSGNIRGITRPGFNTSLLESIAVPVAPLAEQQEIVRRVEKLFAFADQIEARLRQAQTHVDRLTQSLLAKAFRGELVPTEHALATRERRPYESAVLLLDRIHEDSANGSKSNDGSTSKRPRQPKKRK